MKETIRKRIAQAIEKIYPEHVDVVFSVDYPPAGIDADFASNVALVLAKKLKKKPMAVAAALAAAIPDSIGDPELDSRSPIPAFARTVEGKLRGNDNNNISVAPPGFLNFKLPAAVWHEDLLRILKEGQKYGGGKIGKGKKIDVEFVSANPTGPLTVGHGRGAMIGSTLARVLSFLGYKVVREYYFNDGGKQMQNLAESVRLRAKELLGEKLEFPETLYQGEYIKDIAQKLIAKKRKSVIDKDWTVFKDFAVKEIFAGIKKTLDVLDVEFDEYFNELSLFEKDKKGNIWEVLRKLEQKGVVSKKEGAVWLTPPLHPPLDKGGKGGVGKVLVRSSGEPTYRLPDIAYHVHKLQLGYEKIINVLGADHIAQFPDVKFAVGALGFDDAKIEVVINQFVTLAGRKMSTRKAAYVTLDELISEVGEDVTKFFMLMSAPSSHMNFDLELAKDTSEKNPVFRVQYAHARIGSILKKAIHNAPFIPSFSPPPFLPHQLRRNVASQWGGTEGGDKRGKGELLQDPLELGLIRELAKFPELIGEIARKYTVHHLPHYLLGLADRFHQFYERIRVITDNPDETAARLALVKGVQQVLANGLELMGIEPLEKM